VADPLVAHLQVSKNKSNSAKPKLLARCQCPTRSWVGCKGMSECRFKKLGLTEKQLKATLRYIRNDAPIIIHVNLDRV
jgi:hypothetical protein